jgi:membrane-bound serine protease (ClpP class)
MNRAKPMIRRAGVALRRLLMIASAVLLCVVAVAQDSPDAPAGASVPAGRQANVIAVITIKSPHGMDAYTALSVQRRIQLAEKRADAIVIELDTPGGELGAVFDICAAIRGSSSGNIIAWVHDDAYSGGAVTALACREIVCSDIATMGDAGIIQIDPIGMINTDLPEYERQKALVPLMAEITDSARRNGYDEKLVQGFVSLGVELWQVEHVETGQRLFIDRGEYRLLFDEEPEATSPLLAAAPSRSAGGIKDPLGAPVVDGSAPPEDFRPASSDLANIADEVNSELAGDVPPTRRPVLTSSDAGQWRLLHEGQRVSDGRTFFTLRTEQLLDFNLAVTTVNSDEELKAFFGAQTIVRLEPTWSEGLVRFMTLMPVRGVLIVILLLGIFIEMVSPGLVAPGAVALIAAVALLAPPMMVGMASWWEIAAILAGVVFIGLEIFVIPGFGVFGVAGLLALFAGLVGTFAPSGDGGLFPDTADGRNDLLLGAVWVMLSFTTAGVGMYFLSKHLGALPLFGRLVLKDRPTDDETLGNELLAAMGEQPADLEPGAIGVAATPLRPSGRVEINGRLIDVVADLGFIPEGSRVRVVEVTEFRVAVERADEENGESRA